MYLLKGFDEIQILPKPYEFANKIFYMNKISIILIIAGIGLVLTGSNILYLYFTPHDYSMKVKANCKQYGGEWEKELETCVNIDKETCELGNGIFVLPEQLPANRVIPDSIESLCVWEIIRPSE
jgi:hypothetical protein